ncbi:MARCKS-related protein [Oryzias melastigma]|uniref:MARCKS-related protein n=1 Tax=Oryzias melastigma TaxID=30732 RepID=A0A834CKN0_ORYME|nr:MARCKS-related protein [Oryzias melastigma]
MKGAGQVTLRSWDQRELVGQGSRKAPLRLQLPHMTKDEEVILQSSTPTSVTALRLREEKKGVLDATLNPDDIYPAAMHPSSAPSYLRPQEAEVHRDNGVPVIQGRGSPPRRTLPPLTLRRSRPTGRYAPSQGWLGGGVGGIKSLYGATASLLALCLSGTQTSELCCRLLENGHVKTNGDVSSKPDGDAAATNGSAEAAKEPEAGAGGDAIEPAPAADGEATKPEGEAAAKETPKKKKKKFSLKKSFNIKLNLKKSKKSEAVKEEAATAAAPAEEKPAENGAAAPAEEKKEEVKEEAAAAVAEAPKAEEEPAKEETPKEEAKEAAAPAPEATKPTEESSSTPASSEKKE